MRASRCPLASVFKSAVFNTKAMWIERRTVLKSQAFGLEATKTASATKQAKSRTAYSPIDLCVADSIHKLV